MTKETNIIEWAKIGIGALALVLAGYEFLLKDRQTEVARLENSRAFLLRGSQPDILKSLSQTIGYATHPDTVKKSKAFDILIQMTPMHEYLVSWSSCVQTTLCEDSSSRKYLCGRLVGYEKIAKTTLLQLGMGYDVAERDETYSGLLTKCMKSAN